MSKVKALYHIVFCTKSRKMTIPLELKEDLYRFIWKKLSEHKCVLYRIGGIQNHIHMLIDLHPSVALAELMKVIKGSSSNWLKSDSRYHQFEGWASEYFGCTVSPESRYNVIGYIKNQETHHLGCVVDEELKSLYQYSDLEYDPRDMR